LDDDKIKKKKRETMGVETFFHGCLNFEGKKERN